MNCVLAIVSLVMKRSRSPLESIKMSFDDLRKKLPDFAKDIRLNLSLFERDETLTDAQKAGLALACSIASRNPIVRCACQAYAERHLDEAGLNAARAAATIMAMNNVYYRFAFSAGNRNYASMPAGLRMNAIGNPGVSKTDFELWCLAVSAINGCGHCVDAHEKTLLIAGMKEEAIQTAIRLAAIVKSAAVAIEAAEII